MRTAIATVEVSSTGCDGIVTITINGNHEFTTDAAGARRLAAALIRQADEEDAKHDDDDDATA